MDIICFHNPNEENGYLSNWYKCKFVVNNVWYSSMEQYMMHIKAVMFGDSTVARAIIETDDTARIKNLGREVKGFNQGVWDSNKEEVVLIGLKAKFGQNQKLGSKLKSTGNSILAECAVKDTIWGIGLSMKDEKRFNTNAWRGQNILGKLLMETRNSI